MAVILLSLRHREFGTRILLVTTERVDGLGVDARLQVLRDGAVHGTTLAGSRAPLKNVVRVIDDVRRTFSEANGWDEQE
jgi:hypothetical protein